MIGINNLVLSYKKEKSEWTASPHFFKHSDSPVLQNCLNMYESKVGDLISELSSDLLSPYIENYKIRNGVHSIIIRLFTSKEDLISNEDENLSTNPSSSPDIAEISQLRQHLFSYVYENYNGFVTSQDQRETVLNALSMTLKGEVIPSSFWSDLAPFQKLPKKPSHLTSDFVLQEYNRAALGTILYYSNTTLLTFHSLESKQVQYIGRYARKHRVYADYLQEAGDRWIIEIAGPVDLFNKAHAYGRRILLFYLSLFSIPGVISNLVSLNIQFVHRHTAQITLSKDILSSLFSLSKEEAVHEEASVLNPQLIEGDSNLENLVLKEWGVRDGWQINVATTPVQLPEKGIYLPDLILTKDNETILIEIVGFWTSDYLKKKQEKLLLLDKILTLPLIVAIDEKFVDILTLPEETRQLYVCTFQKKVNCSTIEKIVETIVAKNVDVPSLIKKLSESLATTKLSSIPFFQLKAPFDLPVVIDHLPNEITHLWEYSSGHLFDRTALDSLHTFLRTYLKEKDVQNRRIPLHEVETHSILSNFKSTLPLALDLIDYRINYLNLQDAYILPNHV